MGPTLTSAWRRKRAADSPSISLGPTRSQARTMTRALRPRISCTANDLHGVEGTTRTYRVRTPFQPSRYQGGYDLRTMPRSPDTDWNPIEIRHTTPW